MRTAEAIIREIIPEDCIWDEGYPNEYKLVNTPNSFIELAINEARIEAIKECAEAAKPDFNANKYYNHLQVDKKSILKLINDIK